VRSLHAPLSSYNSVAFLRCHASEAVSRVHDASTFLFVQGWLLYRSVSLLHQFLLLRCVRIGLLHLSIYNLGLTTLLLLRLLFMALVTALSHNVVVVTLVLAVTTTAIATSSTSFLLTLGSLTVARLLLALVCNARFVFDRLVLLLLVAGLLLVWNGFTVSIKLWLTRLSRLLLEGNWIAVSIEFRLTWLSGLSLLAFLLLGMLFGLLCCCGCLPGGGISHCPVRAISWLGAQLHFWGFRDYVLLILCLFLSASESHRSLGEVYSGLGLYNFKILNLVHVVATFVVVLLLLLALGALLLLLFAFLVQLCLFLHHLRVGGSLFISVLHEDAL
jgi:hypothetical protein